MGKERAKQRSDVVPKRLVSSGASKGQMGLLGGTLGLWSAENRPTWGKEATVEEMKTLSGGDRERG